MNTSVFKDIMSMDEMAEAFAVNNPGFVPNKQAVGRYAKKMGYRVAKQIRNKIQTYFYIKDKDNG